MRATLGPEDKSLSQTFENMIKKLEITEKDKDVLYTLRCVLKTIQSHQLEGNKQEAILEEKQRQEDEAKIAQGKIVENYKLMEGEMKTFLFLSERNMIICLIILFQRIVYNITAKVLYILHSLCIIRSLSTKGKISTEGEIF